MPKMKTKTTVIAVSVSCFVPSFKMIVDVPTDVDAEEYIDDLFESFVNEDIMYNLEWDFE